jgi:hypothetical protein
MKAYKVFFVMLVFVSFIFLSGCREDTTDLMSIEVNQETIKDEYQIDDFELSSIELTVFYTDGTEENIPLDSSMIKNEDLEKLATAGTHTIEFTYESITNQFVIKIVETTSPSKLSLIYQLGVETGSIDQTYEEWLDSIRGEDGKNIILRVAQDYIQWQHESSEEWFNLIAISELVGSPGNDGSDGIGITSMAIDQDGQLLITYSNDEVVNLGKVVGSDGKDATAPYIGENGNWWIGTEDTGVYAGMDMENDEATDGLYFMMTSTEGVVGYELIEYMGTDPNVSIPNYVYGVPVISIGQSAFSSQSSLLSVDIPSNVRIIKERAFYRTSNLSEVHFDQDSQLEVISSEAFYENHDLSDFRLPEHVRHIGYRAFYKTVSQVNIHLTEQVTYLGSQAFYDSVSTGASIYIEHETKPDEWASDWTNKNELQVHWGVEVDDDYIYNHVTSNQIRIVGYSGNQEQIEIPTMISGKTITHIGSYAFTYNNNIRGVRLSTSVTTLEAYAFIQMSHLKYLIIPSNVINIHESAISSFSEDFVTDVLNFTQIYFQSDRPQECDYEWCEKVYDEFDFVHWGVHPNRIKVSDQLQYIKYNDHISISGYVYDSETITIPEEIEGLNVTKINGLAFILSPFTEIHLPDTLTEIGHLSFAVTYRIKDIIIPNSVQIISEYAFIDSELKFVYIPDSVIIVGIGAFEPTPTILVEHAQKPTGWDTQWSASNTDAHWNVSDYVNEDGFAAVVSNNLAKIINYHGDESIIVIPASLGGYTVNALGTKAIENQSNQLIKVVIPASVQYIEYHGIYSYYSSYIRIYSETSSRPTSWDSNFSYRSYTYYSPNWYYDQNGEPQTL